MELTVEHVSKTYGKTKAVSDVSFTLEKGVYGLLGQNRGGKEHFDEYADASNSAG